MINDLFFRRGYYILMQHQSEVLISVAILEYLLADLATGFIDTTDPVYKSLFTKGLYQK